MTPPALGTIVTFVANPQLIRDCLPAAGTVEYAGEIVGIHDQAIIQPGNIPDVALSVRGRKKTTMRISLVGNYVKEHPGWDAADEWIRRTV